MFKKLSLGIACLVAALAVTVPLLAAPAQAGTNDFAISSYKIHYLLDRDQDERSTLNTTEYITAQFPESDQNHGIERAIPNSYDGHSTSLAIESVTDGSGQPRTYTTSSDGDLEVVRIGDASTYLHGTQQFVITYRQRDVTKAFTSAKADEFYWDTDGTDWKVPIQNLDVSLTIAPGFSDKLSGSPTCYQGMQGSNQQCQLTREGTTFSTTATNLRPGENVTLAVGFSPHTFVAYKMSLFEILTIFWVIAQGIFFFVGGGFLIWLTVFRYRRVSDRTEEQKPIVAEYIPPREASVTTSAAVLGVADCFAAQIIDLAVRHYLKIYQTKQKKPMFSADEYSIEIVKPITDLRAEEQELLNDLFDSKTQVGATFEMKELMDDVDISKRLQDNPDKIAKLVRGAYNLRHTVPEVTRSYRRFSFVVLGLAILTLSPVLLIFSIIIFITGYALWPLTDEGLALVRYLKGLELYIKVAEVERIKMLQSPEGAEKVGVDTSDDTQLVTLYERVLPYAILFNQEKEWNKQLGHYYETTGYQPNWYAGVAGASIFNAASFSTAMSSFSSTAATSSSSYGSTGGGFSGGGGGGGGGGGW